MRSRVSLTIVVFESLGDVAGLGELGEVAVLELKVADGGDILDREALSILGDQSTLGVGEGQDGSTKLNSLEGSVLGDVARSRDQDALSSVVRRGGKLLKHVADIVDQAIAGSFRSDVGSTDHVSQSNQPLG